MVWNSKTKLVSPQFHVMFDDNFDTFKSPYRNIKQSNTMDRLFKTNRYTYDDPFGNEHTYLFSYGGSDIHPDNLTPTIETCQASLTMTPCSDTQRNNSAKNNPQNKSILSMQDLMIYTQTTYTHKVTKMFLEHTHTYTASICKYTPFPNRRTRRHKKWSSLTYIMKNSKSSPWSITHITLNPLMNLTTMSTHYKDITKTFIHESMKCSLTTWTQHSMPCKCKIPMCSYTHK
jgi:hypothetical protein